MPIKEKEAAKMEMLIDFISRFVAENQEDFEKWKAEKEDTHEAESMG